MTKKQKIVLAVEIILPLLVSVLAPLLQARLAPKPCPDERGKLPRFIFGGVLGYAVFIAITVALVKLAWRWIL